VRAFARVGIIALVDEATGYQYDRTRNSLASRKATLSQALTRSIGYPKLREHLGATVAYMTVSPDYPTFIKTLDAHRPRFHDQLELPVEYKPDEDDGKGL